VIRIKIKKMIRIRAVVIIIITSMRLKILLRQTFLLRSLSLLIDILCRLT